MQPMLSLALYRSNRRTGRWLPDLVAGFGQLGQSFYSLARHLHSADGVILMVVEVSKSAGKAGGELKVIALNMKLIL